MRRRALLKSKRDDGAIGAALNFHIRETTTARRFSARHISGWNLHIETIAAAICFVVAQRLVRANRDARAFRRVAGAQRGDVLPFSRLVRIALRRPALRRDQRRAKQQRRAASENERSFSAARRMVSRVHHWGNINEKRSEHSTELCNVKASLSHAVQLLAAPDRACTGLPEQQCERFPACLRWRSSRAVLALPRDLPLRSTRAPRRFALHGPGGFRSCR